MKKIIIAISLMLLATQASAYTQENIEEFCRVLEKKASFIMYAKNVGAAQGAEKDAMLMLFAASESNEINRVIAALIDWAFERPELSPADFGKAVSAKCLKDASGNKFSLK